MRECTTIQFQRAGQLCGQLDAFDVHSGTVAGRKSWDGKVEGKPVDLPNLKAVAAFAKSNGLTFTKIYDAKHSDICSDFHGPSAPCIIR